MKSGPIAQISIPVPLRRVYDFLIPEQTQQIEVGMRVQVPFGRRRHVTGIVVAIAGHSDIPGSRLRAIDKLLDTEPVFDPTMIKLLTWAADYYHHPIGEVLSTALPANLRRGRPLAPTIPVRVRLKPTAHGVDVTTLKRSPVQKRLLELLQSQPSGLDPQQLASVGTSWRRVLALFKKRGWVEEVEVAESVRDNGTVASGPTLSAAQRRNSEQIINGLGSYRAFCLYGITGSGKTEVYMQIIAAVLARGQQVLVLVPEIGLTPQLIHRFQRRFSVPIAILHSQLGDHARHQAWWRAAHGEVDIVLGTRSAVFVPLRSPGLIVLDEEHDMSFKQQDGFRYHARDLAVYRASVSRIPVVLGSATPSLETLANVDRGRYRLLSLPARAGGASLPKVSLVDLNRVPLESGIALPVLEGIQARLQHGEQILVFINRRGYALVLHCVDCDWQAHCQRCDARLTYHQTRQQLRCHHCGANRSVPAHCEACGSHRLKAIGAGTQRVEATLAARFPKARVVRIDRDSTRGRNILASRLEQINAGGADILIGTQLLAKGHHFPKVTLVVVLNADQGLYGIDFRSEETLAQQLLQVAGRSGRAQRPGEVLIQTHHPQHPVFKHILRHDYTGFARDALAQRANAGFPPSGHFALLRAEAVRSGDALRFLGQARGVLQRLVAAGEPAAEPGLDIGDPVPAPMEKRAGRYRAQLLLRARDRSVLHQHLDPWLRELECFSGSRRVRWAIDVDPMEML